MQAVAKALALCYRFCLDLLVELQLLQIKGVFKLS